MPAAPLKDRITKSVTILENGCWQWKLSVQPSGYGQINVNRRILYAHRVSYETFMGSIPEGLQIDHECHNQDKNCAGGKTCLHRRCVNPSHLRVVTQQKNIQSGTGTSAQNSKKTHCPKRHAYAGDNLYMERRKNGTWGRRCKTCIKGFVLRRKQGREEVEE